MGAEVPRRPVLIEVVRGELDGGADAIKRVIGDRVCVEVDLLVDGHDLVAGELLVVSPDALAGAAPEHGARQATEQAAAFEHAARRVPLEPVQGDRYRGTFRVDRIGRWHYTIRAWIDDFATFRRGLERKLAAGQELELETAIGSELLGQAAQRARGGDRTSLERAALRIADPSLALAERAREASSPELAALVARYPDRSRAHSYGRWLPVWVDRERARFSTWYELFPRATGAGGQHGSFASALRWLPYVASMGFDVLYLPPIHPIGRTFRKGKNNAAQAAEGDVGSPWAIGGREGGHKSVHPELGTLEDFDRFRLEAERHGLELALDIALQVTPDHPYVKQHPEWFKHRPDGSIQYAENPPKKYQDIYPFDFECASWQSLWIELKSIFEFWIARGVRIFRVDNPHTKSLAFWRWCIAELTRVHPELIFLAEAFTRPKLMYALAKLGFTQSYTYFTWRDTAAELKAYVQELTSPPVSEFFRPNFWPNTPDILPVHLQHAGRAAFALRLVLAATLSSNYGIYGPAFELLDNRPRAGVEEYLDNEKYELRSWDLDRRDSLRPLITRINAIRRDNAALQQNEVVFHPCDNQLLLCFSKQAADGENVILVVANLDVHHPQSGWVDLGKLLPEPAGGAARPLQLHDLLSDARYLSQAERSFVRLDPESAPAHIFRLRRHVRTEHDFDYFA